MSDEMLEKIWRLNRIENAKPRAEPRDDIGCQMLTFAYFAKRDILRGLFGHPHEEKILDLLAERHGLNSEQSSGKGKAGAHARWQGHESNVELRTRGLFCVLAEDPDISASLLKDWLDGEPRTYDDQDVQLSLTDSAVIIEDLRTSKTVEIPRNNLRKYLRDARS